MAIYVFCGPPLHGKTTISKIVSAKTKIPCLDMDNDLRAMIFGNPGVVPDFTAPKHDKDTRIAYKGLLALAEIFLSEGDDLIICAGFIRPSRQKLLYDFYALHGRYMKIIQCRLVNETEAEVVCRLEVRARTPGYAGGLRSLDQYLAGRLQWAPLELPHQILETSPPRTAEECADEAIKLLGM